MNSLHFTLFMYWRYINIPPSCYFSYTCPLGDWGFAAIFILPYLSTMKQISNSENFRSMRKVYGRNLKAAYIYNICDVAYLDFKCQHFAFLYSILWRASKLIDDKWKPKIYRWLISKKAAGRSYGGGWALHYAEIWHLFLNRICQ